MHINKIVFTKDLDLKLSVLALEAAKLSYLKSDKAVYRLSKNYQKNFELANFVKTDFVNVLEAKFTNDCGSIQLVAFSGTKNWRKYLDYYNVNVLMKKTSSGKIHSGYLELYTTVSNLLSTKNNEKIPTIWSGHSRGGVLAAIAQAQYGGVVYSFGSPNFANKQWHTTNSKNHWRIAFHNDVVTQLPPKFLGYDDAPNTVVLPDFEIQNLDDYTTKFGKTDWEIVKTMFNSYKKGISVPKKHYNSTYCLCFNALSKQLLISEKN